MEITQFLTEKVVAQINQLNHANDPGVFISPSAVQEIIDGAYERGLEFTLIQRCAIEKAMQYIEHVKPIRYGSTQALYVNNFLEGLQKAKDGTLQLTNPTNPIVEKFAAESGKVIKKLLKEGLEVTTIAEFEERERENPTDFVKCGMIYHPELTRLVEIARSSGEPAHSLEVKLVNYLRPYLARILDVTQMKYTHMHQSKEETEKQRIVAEASIALKSDGYDPKTGLGGFPVINGLIIPKENRTVN